MGFLDGLFAKKEEPIKPGLPFSIATSLRPMRLSARKESMIELIVEIKNVSDKPVMVSATCEIPRALGFENVGMAKIKEIRMGELAPGSQKSLSFAICSNSQTPPGTYSVVLTVNQHYRDYSHILNYAKKTVEIRAV
ncbi:MAG: hypothetical protein QW275_01820 [Candidatus Anstonellaceae archaeon]